MVFSFSFELSELFDFDLLKIFYYPLFWFHLFFYYINIFTNIKIYFKPYQLLIKVTIRIIIAIKKIPFLIINYNK